MLDEVAALAGRTGMSSRDLSALRRAVSRRSDKNKPTVLLAGRTATGVVELILARSLGPEAGMTLKRAHPAALLLQSPGQQPPADLGTIGRFALQQADV